VIKNSIVAKTDGLACTIYQASVVENFLYYEATGGVNLKDGATDTTNVIEANPLFVDPENGNFDLAGFSRAVGAGTDGTNLGDLRWKILPADELPGGADDVISTALAAASAGDTLVLVGFGAGLTWAAATVRWSVPLPVAAPPRWRVGVRWMRYRWAAVRRRALSALWWLLDRLLSLRIKHKD